MLFSFFGGEGEVINRTGGKGYVEYPNFITYHSLFFRRFRVRLSRIAREPAIEGTQGARQIGLGYIIFSRMLLDTFDQ